MEVRSTQQRALARRNYLVFVTAATATMVAFVVAALMFIDAI